MTQIKCNSLTILLHFDSIKISKLKSFTLPYPAIEATTPERERYITKEYKAFIVTFECKGQTHIQPITKIFFETYHPLIFKQIINKQIKISARILTIDNYNKHRLWLIMGDETTRNVQYIERLCSKYWQTKIKQGQ
jgi:mRNA deadenylase 3'-5' endonuclease subunit Ccr4